MRKTINIQTNVSRQADQTNINRMRDLSQNRKYHLHNLQTIYKERSQIRSKSQKQQLKRNREIQKFHRKVQANSNIRNKRLQDKINYQNSILRNKLLQVMHDRRKGHSFTLDRRNPYKIRIQEQTYQANLKLGAKLSNIKSQVISKTDIQEHNKRLDLYNEIAQKKSPKKKAYMKSLLRKGPSTNFRNNFDDSLHTLY